MTSTSGVTCLGWLRKITVLNFSFNCILGSNPSPCPTTTWLPWNRFCWPGWRRPRLPGMLQLLSLLLLSIRENLQHSLAICVSGILSENLQPALAVPSQFQGSCPKFATYPSCSRDPAINFQPTHAVPGILSSICNLPSLFLGPKFATSPCCFLGSCPKFATCPSCSRDPVLNVQPTLAVPGILSSICNLPSLFLWSCPKFATFPGCSCYSVLNLQPALAVPGS